MLKRGLKEKVPFFISCLIICLLLAMSFYALGMILAVRQMAPREQIFLMTGVVLLWLIFLAGVGIGRFIAIRKYAGKPLKLGDIADGEYLVVDIMDGRYGSSRTIKLADLAQAQKNAANPCQLNKTRIVADPERKIPDKYIGKTILIKKGIVITL